MKRVIFDCDNTMGLPFKEIDDGLALMYLLGCPDIELVGVTTTFGNGAVDDVYAQTVKLLHALGAGHIPVFRGEAKRGDGPTDAARFLAETAVAHPHELAILAVGPLGNLYSAAKLDPNFFLNVQEIACMGGYLAPLRIGWRNLGELNLSANPEASFAILNAPCPVTLMSAQICLQAPFGWQAWLRTKKWPKALRRIIRNWLLTFSTHSGAKEFYLWDLLPAVYLSLADKLFAPNLVGITSTVQDLETGSLQLGQHPSQAKVNLPTSITNLDVFYDTLFASWNRVIQAAVDRGSPLSIAETSLKS
ncbi:MAG: nucleoside hydrolase [Ardenticatenaceae bacterium]|nr:nucleoside hydrolase [Ardenticatenaceae bacterium]